MISFSDLVFRDIFGGKRRIEYTCRDGKIAIKLCRYATPSYTCTISRVFSCVHVHCWMVFGARECT